MPVGTRTTRAWRAPVAIAVLALLVRLGLVLRSPGGFAGLFGYDPGVYYAAGDALVHGRVPYRDFLFLHPPAVMLATAPFALLGAWSRDEIGFITANCAFMCVGALNAALVVVAGGRLGLPPRAARTGGVVYAVWIGAAGAEVSVRLEPIGTLAFLGCLVCVAPVARARAGGSEFFGGLLAGVACMVKIWWCVPVFVVLAWLGLRSRGRSAIGRFALGAGCAVVTVAGPFLAMAPSTMWRMVVTDQLGRGRSTSLLARTFETTGVRAVFGEHSTAAYLALAIAVAGGALLVTAAWRSRVRLPVALLCVQLAVLAAAPSFFGFYVNYAAASVALVVAAASTVPRVTRWSTAALGAVIAASAAGSSYAVVAGDSPSAPFPAGSLAAGAAGARCVMSDSPGALIELNALSRGLAAGCPDWVDVSGLTHDADRALADRKYNARWQADVLRYLRSGDAVILIRPASGLNHVTRATVEGDCLLARAGPYRVYRTFAHDQPQLSPAACRESLRDQPVVGSARPGGS